MTSLNQRARAHIDALEATVTAHENDLDALATRVAEAFTNGNRVFFFGNGGSSCDAMHIAGEFVGRFVNDRKALPAIALTADSGIITAIANDYSYDYIFARQIEALAHTGDVAIGMSTSGTSPNVKAALAAAKNIGAYGVLFTGEKGRSVESPADMRFVVPSMITAHIQETHMFLLHSLAAAVEKKMGIAG